MSLADELAKLDDLRRRGALTEAEFEAAKATLLNQGAAPEVSGQLADTLDEVRFQNELARLDREWEAEREQYMVVSRYGQRYPPNATGAVVGGVIAVVFGVVWLTIASGMAFFATGFMARDANAGPFLFFPWCFPAFGVLFIGFGIYIAASTYSRAQRYQDALDAYQRRRQHLIATRGKPAPPDYRFRAQ